jgi:tRNA (guanine-N7-)-methyltransferase
MADRPRQDRERLRRAGGFFGRRKGKALRSSQQARLERLLPKFRIDLAQPAPDDPGLLFAGRPNSVRVEIGFGGGEHLAREAALAPDTGFIGVEPFVNGLAKMLAAIEREGLANVRLQDEDAARLLDWLPASSIDRVDLLYPDPWPKRRHWKRRFVNRQNLARIARVLRPGGEFRFASDIDSYVNWTLRHCQAEPSLAWTARRASDWNAPWPGWVRTRYEEKAMRQGRRPAYLRFVRTSMPLQSAASDAM